MKERYFFRRAAGNGWTLVGDAGHHKEFVIGDGITEALLQARSLASAIRQGTDAALYRWWRARDVEALPLFFLGQDEGALGPPSSSSRSSFRMWRRARLSGRGWRRRWNTSSRRRRRSLFDKCFGGHSGPLSADRLASWHNSSRRADEGRRSTASCAASTTARRGRGLRGTSHHEGDTGVGEPNA